MIKIDPLIYSWKSETEGSLTTSLENLFHNLTYFFTFNKTSQHIPGNNFQEFPLNRYLLFQKSVIGPVVLSDTPWTSL